MKYEARLMCIGLVVIAGLAGCATQPRSTQEEILNQHQKVSRLDSSLKVARTEGAEILAPEGYSHAARILDRAMAAAGNNQSETAETAAESGLKVVEKLNRDMANSRVILAEVIEVRDRAYAAGAKILPGNRIAAFDAELKNVAALIENGSIEQAKRRRPKLLSDYSQIELEALKQGTVEQAKAAIADAKRQGAEKYAPKTLAQAEEEMALAVSMLEADRTQTEKAEVHAKRAKWNGERSASIAESVKDFMRRDYTMEDVVLWHQQQLSTINQPFGVELPLNKPGEEVVLSLKSAVSNALAERDVVKAQLQQTREQSQVKIEEAEKKISTLTTEEQAEQKRFEQVQAMFSPNEANVYRQRQNMLISAHGFQFPSVKSEIEANNFPLMNKIIKAINNFPGARIEVTGHTDATGADAINQVLSEKRAEKVASFLIEVGGIAPNLVTFRGFGETRPVASNETREGRAENRRVEIKIINE